MTGAPWFRGRVVELARDVGRLSRRLDAASYDGFLAQRIADRVETLDAATQPTAHDIYTDLVALGASDQDAVEEALAMVDARAAELRSLLGTDQKPRSETHGAA